VQFAWRDYIEALDRFEEALKSPSREVPPGDLHFQMALSHIHLEEYAEARSHLNRCLEQGESSAPVHFYCGICDLGQGKVEQALARFREALRAGPAREDLGRVLFYTGNCLKELERYPEAIEELRKAVEADPEDIANHNLLGFCYYKTGRHEEAVECFRRAVEIDPRSGIDWANLASNLRDLGRTDEAVTLYRKALALDPTIEFARENLARLTGK
jgi:ribosomal protein S12 methylthiotransferase accessory factor